MPSESGESLDTQLREALNEDAAPGNVAWWPKKVPWRMFLRRRSKVADLSIFTRQVPIRSEAECIALASRVDALQDHWEWDRPSGIRRLGGAVCTLRHHDADHLTSSRSLLLETFPELYEDILRVLQQTLETDRVRYCDRGFVPGFTIIEGKGFTSFPKRPLKTLIKWIQTQLSTRLSFGFLHTDGQAASLALPDFEESCPQVSILLPLLLPPQGHGLHVFEATSSVSSKDALSSRRTFIPYKLGTMLIFNGDHWHVSGTVPARAADWRRIMLTGHGIRVNGTWEIYY